MKFLRGNQEGIPQRSNKFGNKAYGRHGNATNKPECFMEQRDSEISIPEFRDGYTTYKKAVTTSIAPNQVKVLKSKGYYQETINVATVQETTNGACVQETNKTTRSYS